jgi:hypothetical protein
MDVVMVFTREECTILPKNQHFIYYGELEKILYFARLYSDTLEIVPPEKTTGGLAVYYDEDKLKRVFT